MKRVYTVGELKKVIKESVSKNEFHAVYGDGVQSDNKRINSQAYKDIEKQTKAYDGGLSQNKSKNKPTTVTPTENKGMSDLLYHGISKEFKDKVSAQLKGYTSAQAEKLHKKDPYGNAEFGDENDVSYYMKHAKDVKAEKDKLKNRGLVGRQVSKKEISDLNDTMFESKKLKNIKFRHTNFLSEGHMISKIPDEFKTEGNKFIMSDSEGNSYIVEWHNNEKPDVEKQTNKKLVNEELNRIKNLYNYKSSSYFKNTTSNSRIAENKELPDMLNKARKLIK